MLDAADGVDEGPTNTPALHPLRGRAEGIDDGDARAHWSLDWLRRA